MEDRVGDVLAERARLDTGAAPGIILSILLHGAITAVAVYAALHHPAAQQVNMLTIRLAPMTPANAAVPEAKAAPAPLPKTLTEPQPVVEPPKPAVVEEKPSAKTAPPSPFGKSTKKPAAVAPAPPPPAVARHGTGTGAAAAAADIPIGSAGVTGIEGDFPYTIYIENMKRLIGVHWFRPQLKPGAATTVYYEIERDGTIRNVKIESASGNDAADRAAQRAILEASPLPPLPFGYSGTFLGVHLTFK